MPVPVVADGFLHVGPWRAEARDENMAGLNGSKLRILIVSYLFPPVGGIGVQRAISLAKYLPNYGYDVHILRATNAGGPVIDRDLVRQIPPAVTVHKAFSPEIPFATRQKLWSRLAGDNGNRKAVAQAARFSLKPLLIDAVRRVLCPEPEILWVPFALRVARRLMRRSNFDVVLVTVPPFSALLVGSALKREFPAIVLVSDFRDEWLSFYLKDFEFQSSDYTRRRAEAIERETVECSDLVAAVNRSSREEIRRRYPDQPDSKFVVASNGYDPEVFANFKARPHGSPRMVVTHIGTVYKTSSPRSYLDALDQLPEEIRTQVETRFVGRISDSERGLLESRKSAVKIMGFMPQAEALKLMEETDYLVLTMTNEISMPGKLFEYMASGKPILAITPPDSEVDRILRETGAGVCAPPNDPGGIQAMLIRAFENWKTGTRFLGEERESVLRYERPRLVEEYGGMIRKAAARQGVKFERGDLQGNAE